MVVPRVGYLWFGFLVLVGELGLVVAAPKWVELGVVVAAPEWVELGLWVEWFAFEGLAAAANCDCSCS